jgi:putative acetyltransferase
MSTEIVQERPDTPDAMALIAELDDYLAPLYAVESRHGFSVDKLVRDGVAFFVTRHDGKPAGCGGIKLYAPEYSEVKRMYVRPEFRGLGLGRQMLKRLTDHSRENGITVVRLETGIYQTEALGLYESYGFARIPPFGEYWDDPVSLCYEMRLDNAP